MHDCVRYIVYDIRDLLHAFLVFWAEGPLDLWHHCECAVRRAPCAVRRAPCAVRRAPCAVRRAPCAVSSQISETVEVGNFFAKC